EGEALDIRELPAINSNDKSNATSNPSQTSESKPWPSLNIKVALDKLFLKGGPELSHIAANINCEPTYCSDVEAKFSSTSYAKPSIISLQHSPQGRELKVNIWNIGEILKGCGLSDDIKNGELIIEAAGKGKLEGKLSMNHFILVGAPLVAKILVPFSSLPGILGLLEDRGIPFERLNTNFSMEQGIIKFDEAIGGSADVVPLNFVKNLLSGSSIGFTASGEINIPEENLALQGVVFPTIYGANSLLGLNHVPGISAVLGGKGRAVIAADFKVAGQFQKIDVTVNPLSLLAPGFLKKLFVVERKVKQTSKNTK
ncbi:MAG: hypothetical protein ACK4M7_08825, partial [Burkholderiales bacterium]